jgi:hypothetical protein
MDGLCQTGIKLFKEEVLIIIR